MADYSQLKVPDLKKILQERGLVISGNKADLIARLQEDDKKSGGGAGAAPGEDEIDWDEDDSKAAPAATAVAAVADQPAVSSKTANVDTATTAGLKDAGGNGVPQAAAEAAVASTAVTATESAPASEAPKQDFSIGIQQTDAEKEAERRAARAKRFGITEDDEAKKLADRAKKFGTDAPNAVVKGLDSALPERRAKRGREEKQGGRNAKRQTPDRRAEPAPKTSTPVTKKPVGRITDDPTEKAKAEARAKRFQAAA